MNSLAPADDDTLVDGDVDLDSGDIICCSTSIRTPTESSHIPSLTLSIYKRREKLMSIYVYIFIYFKCWSINGTLTPPKYSPSQILILHSDGGNIESLLSSSSLNNCWGCFEWAADAAAAAAWSDTTVGLSATVACDDDNDDDHDIIINLLELLLCNET